MPAPSPEPSPAADAPPTLLVLTNLPDAGQAQALAAALVEARLAACVNILAPCTSVYRWNGAIEPAPPPAMTPMKANCEPPVNMSRLSAMACHTVRPAATARAPNEMP